MDQKKKISTTKKVIWWVVGVVVALIVVNSFIVGIANYQAYKRGQSESFNYNVQAEDNTAQVHNAGTVGNMGHFGPTTGSSFTSGGNQSNVAGFHLMPYFTPTWNSSGDIGFEGGLVGGWSFGSFGRANGGGGNGCGGAPKAGCSGLREN